MIDKETYNSIVDHMIHSARGTSIRFSIEGPILNDNVIKYSVQRLARQIIHPSFLNCRLIIKYNFNINNDSILKALQ